MSNTTRVEGEGLKRFIMHDGQVYFDTLRTYKYMLNQEIERARIHTEAAHDAQDIVTRIWRYKLRANADKRIAHWLDKIRNG